VYPLIAASAYALRSDATIDGEAVVCDDAGIADFERLHGREHDLQAILYAFDLLELDGVDLRPLSVEQRKDRLRQLLQGCPTGIHFNEHIAGDGAEVFAHACKLGFEGIVSKDRACPYGSGPSKTWLKIKNLQIPGVLRFQDRDALA
jgi:bifunctional non-homologous end joining protein LigD